MKSTATSKVQYMTYVTEILVEILALKGANLYTFRGQKVVFGLFQSCFEDVQKLLEHCLFALLSQTTQHSISSMKSRQALLKLRQGSVNIKQYCLWLLWFWNFWDIFYGFSTNFNAGFAKFLKSLCLNKCLCNFKYFIPKKKHGLAASSCRCWAERREG